jgi:FG-GAP-like repeat
LLSRGGGRFETEKVVTVGSEPFGLAVGDFNQDGRTDLVVANFGVVPSTHGSFSLLLSNGDGTFQPAVNFAAGDFPDSIAVADFNGDSEPDVVIGDFGTNSGAPSVSLVLGDGRGGFGKPITIAAFGALNYASQVTLKTSMETERPISPT